MSSFSRLLAVGAMAFFSTFAAQSTRAQETCGGVYTVQPGDSLSDIADRMYQNAALWTAIHSNNAASIGAAANNIRTGQQLRLSCINGMPTGLPGGTPVTQADTPTPDTAKPAPTTPGPTLRLLAGDGYPPFTDRAEPAAGMMTEVVERALAASEGADHRIFWINDRAAHLDPMLSTDMADLAFPWIRPACDGTGACAEYLYSDPMFEMLVLIFANSDSGLTFATPADLAGLRLCRPRGFGAVDWLEGTEMTLVQPASAEACFDQLTTGAADVVALNEFTGRLLIAQMGLRDRVEVLGARPLSIETLHLVAHRGNPQAEALIARFNSGLAEIRASGAYTTIIEAHLSRLWAGF
ncbi:LysM peptidoglycan-binding domain-containing protein [Marinovum sp.]|uniref:LysM peptidoglycan-binding domain-containing protein n=1 Tax=Marinovum sp. TaxID=2024839 RepID=UPI003A91CBC8